VRCVRLALMGALGCSAAFAQFASKPLTYHSGPARNLLDHSDGSAETTNWSGYVVLGASFKWVAGSWIVPTADCTGVTVNEFGAFWVGLDGYTNSTVEQIGTLTNCDTEQPVYYAWYEFYPQGMVIIPSITLAAGDRISAEVFYDSSQNQFTVGIKDHTSGTSFSTTGAVPGAARASAEWVAEALCCTATGGILPLTDFGTVTFGEDKTNVSRTNYAGDSSSNGAIGSFPPVDIIEVNKVSSPGSVATSTCTALSDGGTSFSCTWAEAGGSSKD
jgi:hypothetical protein